MEAGDDNSDPPVAPDNASEDTSNAVDMLQDDSAAESDSSVVS